MNSMQFVARGHRQTLHPLLHLWHVSVMAESTSKPLQLQLQRCAASLWSERRSARLGHVLCSTALRGSCDTVWYCVAPPYDYDRCLTCQPGICPGCNKLRSVSSATS